MPSCFRKMLTVVTSLLSTLAIQGQSPSNLSQKATMITSSVNNDASLLKYLNDAYNYIIGEQACGLREYQGTLLHVSLSCMLSMVNRQQV